MAQNAATALESVAIQGSLVTQSAILEIAKLKVGEVIDKAGIEAACKRLQESGLFSSISYRYAPGPKKGWALTVVLGDQAPLLGATIDVPGADEGEAWRWLAGKFGRFDRQAPQEDSAQKFLAGQLEGHLAGSLRGQRLAVRMETDFNTGKSSVSFQPENLPRVQSVTITGNRELGLAELSAALLGVAANQAYTERSFAAMVELNLRPLYEEHGLYRVKFVPGETKWGDAGVSPAVVITEGDAYRLGKVEVAGDDLPLEAMLAAAKFPGGKLANWKQIQQGIWDMEKVVKRTGYFEAAAKPERAYDDVGHVLDLRIHMNKGPLYHFGEVHFAGLSQDLQDRAMKVWRPKPGDPYDYAYPGEFLQAFSRVVDLRANPKCNVVPQKGAGDHVMDLNLVFAAR